MERNIIIDRVCIKIANEGEYKQVARVLNSWHYVWADGCKYTEWNPYQNTWKPMDTIFLLPSEGRFNLEKEGLETTLPEVTLGQFMRLLMRQNLDLRNN